jgi:hypothetical protein
MVVFKLAGYPVILSIPYPTGYPASRTLCLAGYGKKSDFIRSNFQCIRIEKELSMFVKKLSSFEYVYVQYQKKTIKYKSTSFIRLRCSELTTVL